MPIQFDDGLRFDTGDQVDDNRGIIREDKVNEDLRDVRVPEIPTYNPGNFIINVKASTPNVEVDVDGESRTTTPGSINVAFTQLLGDGIRVRSSKTGFNPTSYFIVKARWIEREVQLDNIENPTFDVADGLTRVQRESNLNRNSVTYKRPEIIVQEFDIEGNRIQSNRVSPENTGSISRKIDLYFDMDREEIQEPETKEFSAFIYSFTEDSRLVDTSQDRSSLFTIATNNEDISTQSDDSGTFISGLTQQRGDLKVYIEDDRFDVVAFRIYESNGEFDFDRGDRINTIRDVSELDINIDKHLLIEVEYELAEDIDDVEPEVNIVQPTTTYNIGSDDPLHIDIELIEGESARYLFKDQETELNFNSSGKATIELNSSDFSSVGQYKVFIIPYDEFGDGILSEATINVKQDRIVRVPQFTEIKYPSVVEGVDYGGYDVDFDIEYKTTESDSIQVYVGEQSKPYGTFNREGKFTLNVDELLNSYSMDVVREDEYTIEFKVRLTPTSSGRLGESETITIEFRKSRVQLPTTYVVDNLSESIKSDLDLDIFDINTSKYLTHIANIEGTDFKIISNWEKDDETFTEFFTDPEDGIEKPIDGTYNSSLVLKLFEPLPTSVQPNSQLWISKLKSTPFIDRVTLREDLDDHCVKLRPANFDITGENALGYEMFDEIVGSNSETSTGVIDKYINETGIDTSNLDIKYSDEESGEYLYNNFVHFGSAKELIINFWYKLNLIESYNERIDSIKDGEIYTVGSIDANNEISRIESQIKNVKNGFTAFEEFIYENETTDNKWYDIKLDEATEFDNQNPHSLVNNVPSHIEQDNDNVEFVTFLHMIGQHYDILWSYINGLKSQNRVEESRDRGIIDNLVYQMLESFGWDVDSSIATQQLWQAAFGMSEDGTKSQSYSGTEYQQTIWRRILNNLPYLLKHKGTRRSLSAILATYGVPQSLLTIMEFGGTRGDGDGDMHLTYEDTSSSLVFKDGINEYIEVEWNSTDGEYPKSIEIRVKPTSNDNFTLISQGNWDLRVEYNEGEYGTVIFDYGGSNEIEIPNVPFYRDEYTVMVLNYHIEDGIDDGDVTLHIRQNFNDSSTITHRFNGEANIITRTDWETPATIQLCTDFVGRLDEFRLWTHPLELSNIDNHTLSPDSIDGTHYKASTEDLLVRFDFERPKNRNTDPEILNVAPDNSYVVNGLAVNFENEDEYPFSHIVYERSITTNVPSLGFQYANKIQTEDLELISDLSHDSRATVKSSQRGSVGSNRLGFFFSPMKEINLDIIKTFGDFRIDDFIGNPGDVYEDSYPDLDKLREYYFDRLELDIYEYIQLVRYIDKSLFNVLENLVPARVKTSKGLLIEPHFFNRSKVKWDKPTGESKTLESEINVLDVIENLVEDLTLTVDFQALDEVEFTTEELVLLAEIDGDALDDLSAEQLDLLGKIVMEDFSDQTVEYMNLVGDVDATLQHKLRGEAESLAELTKVGSGGIENPSLGGFGLYTRNGFTERVIYEGGEIKRDKVYVELITECEETKVGTEVSGSETNGWQVERYPGELDVITNNGGIRRDIMKEDCETRLNFQPVSEFTPTEGATVVDGYLPSHFKFISDRDTGFERSYFLGSKQTSDSTIDGSPAVETFVTNPNTLRVTDAGRGSGEPILEID